MVPQLAAVAACEEEEVSSSVWAVEFLTVYVNGASKHEELSDNTDPVSITGPEAVSILITSR